MMPISLDVGLDEALGHHEDAPGAGGVHGVGVLVGPVAVGDVRGDAGDPRVGHRRRHLGLAGGALVVDRGDHTGLVDLPNAGDGLVEVGAVIARV